MAAAEARASMDGLGAGRLLLITVALLFLGLFLVLPLLAVFVQAFAKGAERLRRGHPRPRWPGPRSS